MALLSPILLQKYGRKSIFMCGFLFWCLSNIIIFQIFDENVDCEKCSYKTTIHSLLYISLSIFVIVRTFCLSPVQWVYFAETLPPRALGIATGVYWLTKFFVFYYSYYLALASSKEHHNPTEFIHLVSFVFFFYSWSCIVGYFIILVFVQETKDLTNDKIKKVYENQYYDTISNTLPNSPHRKFWYRY